MAGCFNIVCFFCMICILIGLLSLTQLFVGIYATFVHTDIIRINYLVKTDKFDSYLLYILLAFIGLGAIGLVLIFFSIYAVVKRRRSLSMFISMLWVCTVALNIAICVVSLLYFYYILPQLRSLLVRSLHQRPMSISNELDTLQQKYACCGINGRDDYHNLALDPLPSSCCRAPNCWNNTDFNQKNNSNETLSSIYTKGCYSVVDQLVTSEVWIVFGIATACALFQFLVVLQMCILYQRYRKSDEDPKFVISHLASEIPINENLNNNNNNDQKGSSQTIDETVEITQI